MPVAKALNAAADSGEPGLDLAELLAEALRAGHANGVIETDGDAFRLRPGLPRTDVEPVLRAIMPRPWLVRLDSVEHVVAQASGPDPRAAAGEAEGEPEPPRSRAATASEAAGAPAIPQPCDGVGPEAPGARAAEEHPADEAFGEWARLLGITSPGSTWGPAVVEALSADSALLRGPGASTSLEIRVEWFAGQPHYCRSRRFALGYRCHAAADSLDPGSLAVLTYLAERMRALDP